MTDNGDYGDPRPTMIEGSEPKSKPKTIHFRWICYSLFFSVQQNLILLIYYWDFGSYSFVMILDHSNIYEIWKENKNRQPFIIYLCIIIMRNVLNFSRSAYFNIFHIYFQRSYSHVGYDIKWHLQAKEVKISYGWWPTHPKRIIML